MTGPYRLCNDHKQDCEMECLRIVQLIPAVGWFLWEEDGVEGWPLVAWGLTHDGDVVPLFSYSDGEVEITGFRIKGTDTSRVQILPAGHVPGWVNKEREAGG